MLLDNKKDIFILFAKSGVISHEEYTSLHNFKVTTDSTGRTSMKPKVIYLDRFEST